MLAWLWQLACQLPAVLSWADTPQRAALVTVAVLAAAVLAIELAGTRAISASVAVAAGAIPVRRRVAAGREFQEAVREVLAANAQLLVLARKQEKVLKKKKR